jgi:hypothetical protein
VPDAAGNPANMTPPWAAQRCGTVHHTFGARQLTHLGDNVLSPPNKEELSKNG